MNMKMQNKVKPILKAAAIIVVVIALGTCETLPNVVSDPAVSFESVAMTAISFIGADMKARIKVQNDNPISIPFPEINWNLFVSDASFLSGVVKNGTKIAARGSTIIELPFSVSYEGLYKTISKLISADEAAYRIDLGLRFPLPLLENKTFNSSFKGSIPLPKLPSLSFSGIKFNSLSLTKVEFVLTWLIDNKNAFALNLDKLNYSFAVNGASWASGSAQHITIPARRATRVPVTVNINTISMIQEIVTLATGGRTVNYTCGGEAALSPQGFENIAALRLPFNYSGTTNLRSR